MKTLSVCLIVRDEESVLARCLDSVRGVADELVVVDTGSTDNTRALAARMTDAVYTFEWTDDFSAARNFAFSRATSDYVMWLDADDVVPETTREKLAVLKALDFYGREQIALRYCTAFDAEGRPTFRYYRERIFARGTAVWLGYVHESVPWKADILLFDGEVHHKKARSSGDRNLRMLVRHGAAYGDDARLCYYFCRELYERGLFNFAARLIDYLLRAGRLSAHDAAEACGMLADIARTIGDPQRELTEWLRALAYEAPSPRVCCGIGACFVEKEQYGLAIDWYLRAMRSQPAPTAFVREDDLEFLPCLMLCVCYDRLGDRATAKHYHERAASLRPSDPYVRRNAAYFAHLPV